MSSPNWPSLRRLFAAVGVLEQGDFEEIFQQIRLTKEDIHQLVLESGTMKDGLVDCVKAFDWICPAVNTTEKEEFREAADDGDAPPAACPEVPEASEEISPSGWVAKDEAMEFGIRTEAVKGLTPPELLKKLAGEGCSIPVVEDRAIQLNQLVYVLVCIRCGCKEYGWTDAEGQALTSSCVNLYHLVDLLVKPATASRECSFVELMAEGPQPCKWFVSHWWGEPVCDFTACLRQHAKDRNLDRTARYYWVCAYANNQWNVSGEIGEDPSNSSFRRAMRKASGTVSIVDKDAFCYTRVWCIYETYVSTLEQAAHQHHGSERYLFDIYTNENPDAREAVGITDGIAAVDGTGPKQARRKRHREWRFPFELIQKALDIKMEHAFASRESDRRMILNSIAGVSDLTASPDTSHPGYDLLNDVLHGRFSAASFCKASSLSVDLAKHASALSCSQLQTLCLHFGGDCLEKLVDNAVVILASNLPETLLDLFLGFQGCRKLTDVSAAALGKALQRLKHLHKLELRLSTGPRITDDGLSAFAQGLASRADSLEWLALDFCAKGGKQKISEAGCIALAEGLEHLQLLRQARVSLAPSSRALQKSLAKLGLLTPMQQNE